MIGTAVAFRWIAMFRQHHLDTHFAGALHDRVEVVHLKPEQHAIAVRPVSSIADRAVVMLHLKAVQLQDELTALHQLLIVASAVGSAASEQALIPSAAGFDVGDADQRLRTHGNRVTGIRGTFARSSQSIPEMKCVHAALLLLGAVAAAQTQPKFDAASIRPVADTDVRTRSGMGEKSPGFFFAENMPLDVLIQEAYADNPDQSWVLQSMTGRQRASWQSVRILDEPDWVKSDRFGVTARYLPFARAGKRSQAEMLQDQKEMDLRLKALLEDRLHLRVHREIRNLPVYELVVAKPGLLKQGICADQCRTSEFGEKGTDLTIDGEAMNATELSGTISMVLNRPVIDKTGLSGTFDVHLRWTPEPGEVGNSDTPFEKSSGSIFTVLQEKLGLKLRSATGPLEVLVIDHVEKLSAD